MLGNTGNLAKTGYNFTGWNTVANGSWTSYVPAATFTINADTTLFALWSAVIADGGAAWNNDFHCLNGVWK